MSQYTDSRNDDVTLSYNKLTIITDPEEGEDTFTVNGAPIGIWPRYVLVDSVTTTACPANVGTAIDWTNAVYNSGALPQYDTFTFPSYPNEISLNPALYAHSVTGIPTQWWFPRGGLWNIEILVVPSAPLAAGDGYEFSLQRSDDGFTSNIEVAKSYASQDVDAAGAIATMNFLTIFTSQFFTIPLTIANNTTERLRFVITSNFASTIRMILRLTRLK